MSLSIANTIIETCTAVNQTSPPQLTNTLPALDLLSSGLDGVDLQEVARAQKLFCTSFGCLVSWTWPMWPLAVAPDLPFPPSHVSISYYRDAPASSLLPNPPTGKVLGGVHYQKIAIGDTKHHPIQACVSQTQVRFVRLWAC